MRERPVLLVCLGLFMSVALCVALVFSLNLKSPALIALAWLTCILLSAALAVLVHQAAPARGAVTECTICGGMVTGRTFSFTCSVCGRTVCVNCLAADEGRCCSDCADKWKTRRRTGADVGCDPDEISALLLSIGADIGDGPPPRKSTLRLLESKPRWYAPRMLGRYKVKQAIKRLIELLDHDGDEEVREQAAWALGNLGARSAVTVLIKKIKDPGLHVQGAAIDALGKLGASEAYEPLMAVVEAGGHRWHGRASRALGNIEAEEVAQALMAEVDNDQV